MSRERETGRRALVALTMLGLVLGARVHAASGSAHESDSAPGEPESRSRFVNAGPDRLGSLQAAFVRARQAEGARDAAFHVRREAASLRGVSVPAGIEARFDADGLEIVGGANGTRGRVALRTIACDERRVSAEARMPQVGASPHRMESLRARGELAVSEWYEVGPLGVEQGFDVKARACDRLVLELAVDGLAVEASRDGRIELRDERGVITYDQLFAFDATGRALPSRFETSSSRVSLVVETRGAAWPVTVDPLFYVDEQRLEGPIATLENDSPAARFGVSVAIEGDVAIVGARGDGVGRFGAAGSAYVFRRGASGWRVEAKLVSDVPRESQNFGETVAISGGTVVVGAPHTLSDLSGAPTPGSASVFVREGDAWVQQARLTPTIYRTNETFGTKVAIDGNRIVVADREGEAAYVFERSGATWTQRAVLMAPREATGFAASVIVSGDTVLVGADEARTAGQSRAGAVFEFTPTGSWGSTAEIVASDPRSGAAFGTSLAIDGERLVVGAIGAGGAAYVLERVGGVWQHRARLEASDTVLGLRFGVEVALEGDTLAVAANEFGRARDGVYVFQRSGASWNETTKLVIDGVQFADSVALDGGVLLMGARNMEQVAVFTRSGGGWSMTTTLAPGRGPGSAELGSRVAISGDTAVVRANLQRGASWQGVVYVFRRMGASWELEAELGDADSTARGLAIDGDVVCVGTRSEPEGGSRIDAVRVYRREGTTWSEEAELRSSEDFDSFGESLALEGSTLVVGAPYAGDGAGAAYVFERVGSTWAPRARLEVADRSEYDLGASVALSGDVALLSSDGSHQVFAFRRVGGTWALDGAIDGDEEGVTGEFFAVSGDFLAIGAFSEDDSLGAVYVHRRVDGAWQPHARLVAPERRAGDYFGAGVALQRGTLLVGAAELPFEGTPGPGSVHVFRLTGDVWTHELRVVASDAEPGDQFGRSLALDGEWMIAGSPSRARGPYEDPRHGGAYVARLSGLPEPEPEADAGVGADAAVGTDGSVTLPDGGPATGDPDGGGSEGGGSSGCSCATTSSDGAPSSVVFLFGATLLALRPSRKRRRASSRG